LKRFENGPYAHRIRPDVPDNIANASWNVLDNVAKSIRSDHRSNTVIYVIGLKIPESEQGGYLRIANDPRSPVFEKDRAAGLFLPVAAKEGLAAAFAKIGEDIAKRVSQ
jgi:hypothetical protein